MNEDDVSTALELQDAPENEEIYNEIYELDWEIGQRKNITINGRGNIQGFIETYYEGIENYEEGDNAFTMPEMYNRYLSIGGYESTIISILSLTSIYPCKLKYVTPN